MMKNVSNENLKKLKICDDLKKDRLFVRFMQVCRNDIDVGPYVRDLNGWDYEPLGFFHYLGNLTPLFLFVLCWQIAKYPDDFIYVVFFIGALIISGIISLFAVKKGFLCFLGSVLNCFILFMTFREFWTNASALVPLCIKCIIMVFSVNIFFSISKKRNNRKQLYNNEKFKKYSSKFDEYEQYYRETEKLANERLTCCHNELVSRGETPSNYTRLWWQSNFFAEPLKDSTNLLNGNHYLSTYRCFEREAMQSYGTKTSVYTDSHYYNKKYFIRRVSKEETTDIMKKILEKEWECITPKGQLYKKSDEYEIFAFCCQISVDSYYDEKTTYKYSPSQTEVEKKQTEIDRKYDKRERIANAYEKGVAMTVDELTLYSGGTLTSPLEQIVSASRRKNALDKYVSNNTSFEQTSKQSEKSRVFSDTFIYVIDGNVVYNKSAHRIFFPNKHLGEREKINEDIDFIKTRNEEIEAFFDFYISTDPIVAFDLAEKIWCANLDASTEKLASKIMHTIAVKKEYEKYYIV